MSRIVLDAGALLAVERDDRSVVANLRIAHADGVRLTTTSIVLAQVWRDGARQARLARLLRAVDVRPIDEPLGRDAGVLLGRAGMGDPVDATVAVVAATGDRIITSDPDDLRRLVEAAGTTVTVVPC